MSTSPKSPSTLFSQLLEDRLSRRALLKGLGVGASVAASTSWAASAKPRPQAAPGFTSLPNRPADAGLHVPDGYRWSVVAGWGDPLMANAGTGETTAANQPMRFGYNNDYIAYHPFDGRSDHGLLSVNHEYTCPSLMFSGVAKDNHVDLTPEQTDIEMTAHGHSVMEVKRIDGAWAVQVSSPYNRRITAKTPMSIRGPAAGHARMKTAADPTGRLVLGTFGNCAGGQTPWATTLLAEENINGYFFCPKAPETPTTAIDRAYAKHNAFGIKPTPRRHWFQHVGRFDARKAVNEPNRHGWIVELDPFDPQSTPIKRTALGRFKHECAETCIDADGHVVVYMGDDEHFEHVYKFVSQDRFTPGDRVRNANLLDTGTLYAARFDLDGLTWLPLVHGTGPLTAANGFADQGDVVIDARRAARLLGATQMDRPEDIAVDPKTGQVYVMLTKNKKRKTKNPVNPRIKNRFGHILEITPPAKDGKRHHAATQAKWEVLLLAGDPQAKVGARYHKDSPSWLACPDNCAFDKDGQLWVGTDGAYAANIAEGLWYCGTVGEHRGLTKKLVALPIGAELCGPCFTPDATTLFVAVQHPGEGSKRQPSTRDNPTVRWPDPKAPPRPAVVAIQRDGGGVIGT